jgi:hypothetical protein
MTAQSNQESTMARHPGSSLDDIVKNAIEGVVERASAAIARSIAATVAQRLEAELKKVAGQGSRGRPARAKGTRPRTEITRWAADRRARRVPTFVIELTGLKTKKSVVAKYGDGVIFEKGKPAPKTK